MENLTKLNLACGRDRNKKLPTPWLNVDLDGDCADYHCDISKMPMDWTNRFDEVRASHVLEHFFMNEFDSILSEWLRVLKPGGSIRIIVPDLDIIIEALSSGVDTKNRQALSINKTTPILTQIFGFGYESTETTAEWRHRFLFNKELIHGLLERQATIREISFYDRKEDPAALFGINDDSQNPFSLCIHAFKKLQ